MSRCLVCVFLLVTYTGLSQDVRQIQLPDIDGKVSVAKALTSIEDTTSFRFFFRDSWLQHLEFDQRHSNRYLVTTLDAVFEQTDLSYYIMDKQSIVIINDPTQAIIHREALAKAKEEGTRIRRIDLGESNSSNRLVTITGTISDLKTGDPLAFASVQLDGGQDGTVADATGGYSITVKPGSHILQFSFVDYEDYIVDVSVFENGTLNVELETSSLLLNEIVVEGQSGQELSSGRIGQIELFLPKLKHAPALMGEVDIIKQIQLLPGVTTVGEAATGFNVRGGSVDQNLILYDDMPIFNSSHVFGFLTAFNSEAIRDVVFYRGGIPASYGGRASSVLDIKSLDGDFNKWNVKAGIGIITSNILAHGPIKKNKTSIAASFRSSYSNWLIRSIRTDFADLRRSSVFFYDGTLKLAHRLSDRTKITYTGYSSRDSFTLTGDSTYRWNNFQSSASMIHEFSSKLSGEFSAGLSSYGYNVLNDDLLTASELSFSIDALVAKANFFYDAGKHNYNFGLHLTNYIFQPGELQPKSERSNARPFKLDKQVSVESGLYFSDQWSVTDKMQVEGGLRMPLFLSLGKETVYTYEPGQPLELTNISDTLNFKSGEIVKAYFGLAPRLSITWMTDPKGSVKLGYNRMYQYLHLVTNTTAVTPIDIWQPSGYYFKPQIADQVSVGYFKDIAYKKHGFSAEVFYKVIQNILDFKDGAQLILNRNLETDLLQGKGNSYGIETSVYKNEGQLTWTLNYTFSRSFRIIDGPSDTESINQGNRYPASFDQPHNMNLSWKLKFSKRHYLTGNFTYQTGRPVTIPLSAFRLENTTVAYFSKRNQFRIPDYHRLDLAFVIDGNHKRNKRWEGSWVFSIYNVYGRKNPYTVFFQDTEAGIPKPFQLSIIGTVFPSVSYNVKLQ